MTNPRFYQSESPLATAIVTILIPQNYFYYLHIKLMAKSFCTLKHICHEDVNAEFQKECLYNNEQRQMLAENDLLTTVKRSLRIFYYILFLFFRRKDRCGDFNILNTHFNLFQINNDYSFFNELCSSIFITHCFLFYWLWLAFQRTHLECTCHTSLRGRLTKV